MRKLRLVGSREWSPIGTNWHLHAVLSLELTLAGRKRHGLRLAGRHAGESGRVPRLGIRSAFQKAENASRGLASSIVIGAGGLLWLEAMSRLPKAGGDSLLSSHELPVHGARLWTRARTRTRTKTRTRTMTERPKWALRLALKLVVRPAQWALLMLHRHLHRE